MFKKLGDSKKCFLSTGKCVDNELFVFGAQYATDHSSRLLIIDSYDEISSKIETFGSTVLPAILSSWVCCDIVKDVLNFVNTLPPPRQIKMMITLG